MPVVTNLDGTACSACGHKFSKNEGRYAVNGATCMTCYDNKDIKVHIGGHEVSQKLLNEYADAVEAVRRGAILANSRADPLILMRREQNRIAAHKRIFEAAGLPYGDHHWEDRIPNGTSQMAGGQYDLMPKHTTHAQVNAGHYTEEQILEAERHWTTDPDLYEGDEC